MLILECCYPVCRQLCLSLGKVEFSHCRQDLLTIRADRDVYYYGCDELFTRHPDIIKRLCQSAQDDTYTGTHDLST